MLTAELSITHQFILRSFQELQLHDALLVAGWIGTFPAGPNKTQARTDLGPSITERFVRFLIHSCTSVCLMLERIKSLMCYTISASPLHDKCTALARKRERRALSKLRYSQ